MQTEDSDGQEEPTAFHSLSFDGNQVDRNGVFGRMVNPEDPPPIVAQQFTHWAKTILPLICSNSDLGDNTVFETIIKSMEGSALFSKRFIAQTLSEEPKWGTREALEDTLQETFMIPKDTGSLYWVAWPSSTRIIPSRGSGKDMALVTLDWGYSDALDPKTGFGDGIKARTNVFLDATEDGWKIDSLTRE